MNILAFEVTITKLVAGIYKSIASIYGILMKIITTSTNFADSESALTIIQSFIYTLLGIFMVFRLLISLLNYLINPDKVSDKQVGGGKLLMRIVVSLVLLLSLNSIVFPTLHSWEGKILDGILGIFEKIGDTTGTSATNPGGLSYEEEKAKQSIFYDNVKADDIKSDSGMSCTSSYNSLPKFHAPTLGSFSDAYRGCPISYVKIRFREFMDEVTQNAIKSPHDDSMRYDSSLANKPGKNNHVNNYSYRDDCSTSGMVRGCYDIKMLVDGKYVSDDDYIFTGFNIAMSNSLLVCKDDAGNFDCDNVSFEMSGIKVNQTGLPTFDCTYIYRDTRKSISASSSNGTYMCDPNRYKITTSTPVRVRFTATNEGGYKFDGGSNYKWNVSLLNGNGSSIDISKIKVRESNSWGNDAIKKLDQGICPASIVNLSCSISSNGKVVCGPNGVEDVILDEKSWNDVVDDYKDVSSGLTNYGKGNDWEKIKGEYQTELHERICKDDEEVEKDLIESAENGNAKYADQEYLDWARALVVNFIGEEDCSDQCRIQYQKEFLTSGKADEQVGKLYKNNNISFDALFALIAGILFIVFLVILCVEVAVRFFKLLLLEIIAPIAVVSYMSPSDKVFNQWTKMYGSTYADLFIKLFGINAAFVFLGVINQNQTGWASIAFTFGAFVFAKAVPNIISKLFGFESSSEFKEIGKVIKAGALGAVGGGIAAGAALGTGITAVAATKGQSWQNKLAAFGSSLGTGVSSTFKGIMGGANGKVMSGADAAKKANYARADLYRAGYGAAGVLGSALSMGLYDPNKKDERIEKAYDDILSARKNVDETLEGDILKGKDAYRVSGYAAGSVESQLNGLSMQQVDNVLKTNKIDGRDLSSDEVRAFGKARADHMEAAKFARLQSELQKEQNWIRNGRQGTPDFDQKTVSYAHAYDRTVGLYASSIGTDISSSDPDYSYDFKSLKTMESVVNRSTPANAADALAAGKDYKATKGDAEDAKVRFSTSSTRGAHIKTPKK